MTKKIKCYNCNKIKDDLEFTIDKSANRGRHGYCKRCKYMKASKRKAWLEPNHKLKVIEYRRKQKALSIEYKGGKCIDCGYNKHPAAMCFHHVDKKYFEIADLIKNGFKKAKVELDKCVLLCHNCHEIRHYGYYKGIKKNNAMVRHKPKNL